MYSLQKQATIVYARIVVELIYVHANPEIINEWVTDQ